MRNPKYTKSAQSNIKNETQAIAFLAQELSQDNMAGVMFFCSSDYDLDKISRAIKQYFSCPVIGCTTAGEINTLYDTGGITGVSFSSDAFVLHSKLFKLESELSPKCIDDLHKTYYQPSKFYDSTVGKKSVGFLLIDGLSKAEEKTINQLHIALPSLPIIGGSAGDGLHFKQTHVFHGEKFHGNSAVFTFIETRLDFTIFQLQHFQPSNIELVITDSTPESRTVNEIDGEPAADVFAETLNISVDELNPNVFSMNPLMIKIGKEWHVRSIQKSKSDGSLLFYSAIENGLPLTIGKGAGITRSLKEKTNALSKEFSNIELTLGCDCILRRLEITQKNKKKDVEKILNSMNFVGFNTYGEQYSSIHVNQTLTGIVFGEKHSV